MDTFDRVIIGTVMALAVLITGLTCSITIDNMNAINALKSQILVLETKEKIHHG